MHFYTFINIVLNWDILFNLRNAIKSISLQVSNFWKRRGSLIVFFCFFLLFPLLLTKLFLVTLQSSLVDDTQIKKAILGIYTIYITISTVLLSVGLIFISLFPTTSKRSSNFRILKKTDIKEISSANKLFLTISGLAIIISLFGYFLVSLIPRSTLGIIFYEYFSIASFFVLSGLFGLFFIFYKMKYL